MAPNECLVVRRECDARAVAVERHLGHAGATLISVSTVIPELTED
jgi:hypothetical protein